jgi:hypothetical protein
VLTLKAVSGAEGAARLMEMRDDNDLGMGAVPGLAEMQKKKDEMKIEFRVSLPNAISSANGTKEGKTVTWIVDRKKTTDPVEFATQLGTVWETQCPMSGLTLVPSNPTRLALGSFSEITQAQADGGTGVDTNRIAAAAKFVPYALKVTRSVDLSGEGAADENVAQLTGAVVLPSEFTPQKLGEPALEEVVDARGNDLKFKDDSEARMFSMRYSYSGMSDEEDEEGEDGKAAADEYRRVVQLAFRPPDWKVNEIARIKGAVELRYFSGSQLVKLTNAVPGAWITDASKGASAMFGMDSDGRVVSDPKLDELGMNLRLTMGMTQNAMTMLVFNVGGPAAILDAQVYDAAGRPWPTFLQTGDESPFSLGDDDGQSCPIMVAGKPTPPLSIAFLASGNATSVHVPIQIEKVPVNSTKEGESRP